MSVAVTNARFKLLNLRCRGATPGQLTVSGRTVMLYAQGEKMNPIRNSCAGLITAAALATTLSSAGLAAGTYDINVVLPLTGSAAFVGQGERDALLALADQINATGGIAGDKLNFIFQDDQTQPQLAVRLASTCP